jgi:predicted AlkP superfamily phosphohydrolase/phosphomutase
MAKKVVLIGLDAAIPTLIQQYFDMNKLPNMKALVNEGTWAQGIPVFPTHTASNWNSISTGAWPTTHGVTDMGVHLPGTPLTEIKSGFYSDLCQAEQIWVTCERFDKKSILLKYIGSWPPNIKNSIQVEGFGAPGGPSARPWGSSPLAVSNSSCYSSVPLENANVVNFYEGKLSDWKVNNNSTSSTLSCLPPIETEMNVGPLNAKITYNVLLLAYVSEDKYDTALIAKNKDSREGFLLREGQVSQWLIEDFEIGGRITKGTYRMKLMEIGVNTDSRKEKFKLFVSQIFPLEGWTFPQSIAMELTDRFGPFLESISHFPYVFGWIDENTYLDDVCYQGKWMGNATKYLVSKYVWDLYMMQWHGIDNVQHAFLRFDKSVLTKHESELCDNVVLRSYEIADDLVGDIVQATSKTNEKHDDEIYTFVLSDHGHVMGKRRFFINGYLCQKGLIKLKRDAVTRKINIDWKNTQAFAQGMVHLYVNLKGRDPDGAVQPGKEYEDMVKELIDILYDIKDPITGIRPVSLALSNKDAEFLGLSGERAGDVIIAANSVYVFDNRVKISDPLFEDVKVAFPDGSIHGAQLPSVDLGEHGTIKSMFIAHGPNIKKGHIRKKPIKVVDIAPTISYILNIPAPRDSEGGVMYDLFQ